MTRAEKDKQAINIIRKIMWIPDHLAYVVYWLIEVLVFRGKAEDMTETQKFNNFEGARSFSYMFVIGLVTSLGILIVTRVVV